MKIKNPCAISHCFENTTRFAGNVYCSRCKEKIPAVEILTKLLEVLSK